MKRTSLPFDHLLEGRTLNETQIIVFGDLHILRTESFCLEVMLFKKICFQNVYARARTSLLFLSHIYYGKMKCGSSTILYALVSIFSTNAFRREVQMKYFRK